MTRIGKIVNIKMSEPKLSNRPGISEDIAPLRMLKNEGETRPQTTRATHQGRIHATVRQPLQSNLTEFVFAHERLKPHPVAKRSQIVSDYRRRRTQRQHHM